MRLYSPVLVVLLGGALRAFCDGVLLYASVSLLLAVSVILHLRESARERRKRHG